MLRPMSECRNFVIDHIVKTMDTRGQFCVNQHELAGANNFHSGQISQVLIGLRKRGLIEVVTKPAPRRPAVYRCSL